MASAINETVSLHLWDTVSEKCVLDLDVYDVPQAVFLEHLETVAGPCDYFTTTVWDHNQERIEYEENGFRFAGVYEPVSTVANYVWINDCDEIVIYGAPKVWVCHYIDTAFELC